VEFLKQMFKLAQDTLKAEKETDPVEDPISYSNGISLYSLAKADSTRRMMNRKADQSAKNSTRFGYFCWIS